VQLHYLVNFDYDFCHMFVPLIKTNTKNLYFRYDSC